MSCPTPGMHSVLSLMPATGEVRFSTRDGESWSEPIIAYAVVVVNVETSADGRTIYETAVDPVILSSDDGIPDSVSSYLAGRTPGVRWRVAR